MKHGGKMPKVKGKKYNDTLDAFAFAHSIFGDSIGRVDAIKFNETDLIVEANMKKEDLLVPPTYQRILYQQEKLAKQRKEAFKWWNIKAVNPVLDFPKPIVVNIEEVEEIQCNTCKAKIQPNIELHYTAKLRKFNSPFATATLEMLYDAYDCPLCGSQILLGQRLEKLK